MLQRYRAAALLLILLAADVGPAHADTIKVTIDNLVLSPALISAKVGDTIQWVNNDIVAHTATMRGGWDVMIKPKASAMLVLKNAGDVDYYCRFHPTMTGRISVAP